MAGKNEECGWSTNALYGADKLSPSKAAIIVEGELDALTIEQEAGDIIAAVATGSTSAARKERWIRRLSACSLVLVAFDRDEAGRKAARFWGETLEEAYIWWPVLGDVNDMHRGGVDVRAWVQRGLEKSRCQRKSESDLAAPAGSAKR